MSQPLKIQQESDTAAVTQGLAALAQKDFGAAANIYRKLLQADRNNPGLWVNLSIALRHLGHRAASLGCAKRAVALNPSKLDYLVNVSDSLISLGRTMEAYDILSEAVQMAPQNSAYRHRYSDTLWQLNKVAEALDQINIAHELNPSDTDINWRRSTIQLSLGNLAMRWKRGNLKENAYGVAQWTGQDLTGKTILLHEEQGIGDTILAARYIPLVKQRGARVIFQCRTALHELFKTIPGLDRLPQDGPLGETFHYHAAVLSLPGIFGTTLDSIPPVPKLCPAESLPEAASRLLALGKDRFRVGIIWSGNPEFKDNHKRAVSFSRFLPLAGIPGVQLYSLQKGAPEKELAISGTQSLVLELGPHLNNFADTAAVLEELDLVIMTDSSVAHLAGSLGRPVWNLLNSDPYWLYMTDRQDSPWYPSMRLFRQPKPGDWDSVFKEVTVELKKAVAAKA